MATFHKYNTDPYHFLSWYYNRFVSVRNALPNAAHQIIAREKIRVITQNVDGLHVLAGHPKSHLVEIHGNLHYKRKVNALNRAELVPALWDEIDTIDLKNSLGKFFNIGSKGEISNTTSYRPHILLFDEYYTELYEMEKARQWMQEAEIVIFMGTSNAVGITSMALDLALDQGKEVIVVDPNPAPSFKYPGVQLRPITATAFCMERWGHN
jgi:NAD-dependent deacetylase